MVVCVAGPIAAGKNYYCSKLQEQGFFCLDADAEIHKIIQEKQNEILSQFEQAAASAGVSLRAADGSLDRRALGRLLFRRPELLERQERIVYPEFEARVQKLIDTENARKNQKAVADQNGGGGSLGLASGNGSHAQKGGLVINAALLYKTPKILRQCQKIIYIDAPLLVRAIRIRRRDKLSFLQIARRIKSQRGLYEQYKKFADENGIEIVRVKNFIAPVE
ncbi:MAG: dephospho-CoA kinase [Treponema sp.]|nr:dephospho-CoA kinase [Treponema sp.]